MARTATQIAEASAGAMFFQLAGLMARVEQLTDEQAALQQQVAALTKANEALTAAAGAALPTTPGG